MKLNAWLVYRARDSSLRTVTRQPNLGWDEIAWRLSLTVPEPWGRISGAVNITLPESPPPEIIVTEIAQPNGASSA